MRHPLELLAETAAVVDGPSFDANDIITQRTPKLRNLAQQSAQPVYTTDAVSAFFARRAAREAKS